METNDKKRILEMIRDGKISVDDGIKLIGALNPDSPSETDFSVSAVKSSANKRRKLRIDVVANDGYDDHANVSIAIPLNVVKAMLPLVNSGIIPENARTAISDKGIDMDAVMTAIETIMDNLDDFDEEIVSVDAGDGEEGARVKIYVA